MRAFVLSQPEIVAPWVWARAGGVYSPKGDTAIGLAEGNRLIAGVVYESFHPGASIAMHVAAEPNTHWATYKNLSVWFGYPFHQLAVRKVLAPVKETNHAARRFNEHVGFVLETSVSDVYADGALLIYTMTKDQCRFLGD